MSKQKDVTPNKKRGLAVLGYFSPKYLLLRLPDECRRLLLTVRLKLEALRQGSTVFVDIRRGVYVGRGIRVEIRKGTTTKITVLRGSYLGDDIRLRLGGGEVWLGEVVDIRAGTVLNIGGGKLTMDGYNNIGWGGVIHCAESVRFEKFAHLGEYVTLVDSSHYYSSPDEWSYKNARTSPVHLGKDAWVCPKSTIISGVAIGDNTIVAANSCVIKDMPSGVLVSGVPAKVVRKLDLPWID